MSDNHNDAIGHRVIQADVAEFLDVDHSTVCAWVRRGMPIRSDGTTSLPAVIQWLYCLGPRRSEKFRDDTLAEHIRRMLDE